MVNIFVIVIASFDNPYFIDFIKIRKLQFKAQNIPHCFVFEGDCPGTYERDIHDIFVPKVKSKFNTKNEQYLNMTLKFLKTLQLVDEQQYDYIVRVNISTYLNMNLLSKKLESEPRTNYIGGNTLEFPLSDWSIQPTGNVKFVSGTCMIFSKDIIYKLKQIHYDNPDLETHTDDVVLSYLAKKEGANITHHKMNVIKWNMPTKEELSRDYIYRCKHFSSDPEMRRDDVLKWIFLLHNC